MQLFDAIRLPLVVVLLGSQLVAAGGFQNSCRSCGIALCQGKSLGDYGNCASLSCECQRTDWSWVWSTLGFDGIIQNTCGQLTRGGGMAATCHNEELLQDNTLLHAQCKDCSGRDAWSIINIGDFINNRNGVLSIAEVEYRNNATLSLEVEDGMNYICGGEIVQPGGS